MVSKNCVLRQKAPHLQVRQQLLGRLLTAKQSHEVNSFEVPHGKMLEKEEEMDWRIFVNSAEICNGKTGEKGLKHQKNPITNPMERGAGILF